MKKAVWRYPFKNDVTNIEDRIWGKEVIENNYNFMNRKLKYIIIMAFTNLIILNVLKVIKIINSIDEHNRLNQLPDELHPKIAR